jgi:hypothetical protein
MTNPVGRPLSFKNVEELEAAIDAYFDYCDNRLKQVHSKEGESYAIANPEPYTMSGLAYALGVDRKTIINYQRKDEYFHTINRARARVEADIDRRMNDKETFTPGLIFNAKVNFGWIDQTNIDVTTNGKDMPAPILGNVTNVSSDNSD